jgi:lipopolysaccharide heptosyltransferase II
LNITLMKKLDGLLGTLAAAVLPPARRGRLGELRRILVIRPGGIGDGVLLAPALTALKERFPVATVTVLAEARNAAFFSLCPAVSTVLLYHKPGDLARVLKGGYDLVIDTEQWHRLSAVVARLTRSPISIGYATNERRRLFAHGVGYSHDDYEVQSFFRLLEPLGITPPDAVPVPFLKVPAAADQRAAVLLAPLAGKNYIAVFPGASIVERRWGAAKFRAVAEAMAADGYAVVVVGGEGDQLDGAQIARDLGLNLAGKTSLAETAAVLAKSSVLLSGDSGVLHLAVGLAVPTVSLFGPGLVAKWGPQGAHDVILNKHLPCSPCTRFGTTPPCPAKGRCLSDISVAEVSAALRALLGR